MGLTVYSELWVGFISSAVVESSCKILLLALWCLRGFWQPPPSHEGGDSTAVKDQLQDARLQFGSS